ncbi:MAG TPA: hypothetical protein ENG70_03020 [Candidatus Cloacimonetes bacterium]|nr:hypothetical protein [Candidatus Cloacimonadota bacterium]HEX37815.1 hypothetical protein [Candidatus Cloacimonadota bacterium]
MKIILIILGTISLFIGTIGIFIPGLPTTMWVMMGISVHLFPDKSWVKFLTTGMGVICTVVMGFVVPTVQKRK